MNYLNDVQYFQGIILRSIYLALLIAGIDVGHKFFSRVEMVVVGFHNHWLSGIDFIGGSGCKVMFMLV